MSKLIFKFPLQRDAVSIYEERLWVEFGNGVRLTTSVPAWVENVKEATLELVMEVEGSPPDAPTVDAPVE